MSRHTLDTNIIINLEKRYPRDVFGALWDKIEAAAIAGEICLCEEIHDELNRGGDELYKWAKGLPGFVCDITEPEIELADEISDAHPGWVRQRANAGDPFIIAHAATEPSVIVTEERRAGAGVIDKNQKVPNVADEYDVTCIDFIHFVRGKGWKFI